MNPNIFAATNYSVEKSSLYLKDIVATDEPIVGICDYNSLAGVYNFSKYAAKNNKKTVVGTHITVKDDLIVSIHALNDKGWSTLSKIVSEFNIHKNFNIEMLGGDEIFVTIDASSAMLEAHLNGQKNLVSRIINKTPKNRFAISVSRTLNGDQGYDIAKKITDAEIPIIAAPKASYIKEKLDVFQAISGDQEPKLPIIHKLTEEEIQYIYSDLPGAVDNLVFFTNLASDFKFKTAKPSLPHFTDSFDEKGDLTDEARKNLKIYLHKNPELDKKEYSDRLEYELEMITRLGFSGYFLIVADYIRYANEEKIPVGPGRGSGAGSLVAMCLKITSIDPIRYGLFFERFINPDRISPPDFDIDFCEQQREKVIRYIAQKYGSDYTCQIGTWNSMKPRAAWRAAARARKIPMGVSNAVSKAIPDDVDGKAMGKDAGLEEAMHEKGLAKILAGNPEAKDAMLLAINLQDMLSSRSRHAAGIIIADNPLSQLTPLTPNEEGGLPIPVSEFDMKGVEDQGLIKFDFLGLKTLTIIDRACKLIEKDKGYLISPWELPEEDQGVMEMISNGWTVNVFQLESEGMTKSAKEINIDRFSDIIALVALYRPGPMDQIPVYAARKGNPSLVSYVHPALKESLEETYGIPVYQEQIMAIGRTIAGYSLGQADILRRAMGKKIAEEMARLKDGFIKGCIENDKISPRVNKQQAEDLFALIEKFANYGFNKAHAAAYARISFVTAYLKRYHYHHFTAAALTQDGYGKNEKGILKTVHEMNSLKTPINYLQASINKSEKEFSVESEDGFIEGEDKHYDIRFGLVALKGLNKSIIDIIVDDRNKNGIYESFSDFMKRTSEEMPKASLITLIYAGVFDDLYPDYDQYSLRHALINIIEKTPNTKDKRIEFYQSINERELNFEDPSLLIKADMISNQQKIYGFNIKNHPVDPYRPLIANYRLTSLEAGKKVNNDMLIKTIAYLAHVEDNSYENIGVLTDKNQSGKIVRMNVRFEQTTMPPNKFEDGNKDGVFLFEIDIKGKVKSWAPIDKITDFSKVKILTEDDEKDIERMKEKELASEKHMQKILEEMNDEEIPF